MRKFSKWFLSWWTYLFYAALIALQASTFFDPKAKRGALIQAGIFVGFYAGGIVVALWNRYQQKERDLRDHFRQQSEQFDRKLWQIKTEAEIRARVAAGRPATQNKNNGTSAGNLEEYL